MTLNRSQFQPSTLPFIAAIKSLRGAMETLCLLFYLLLTSSIVAASPVLSQTRDLKITPKVFIIDAFEPEEASWHGIPEFNVLEHNITVSGFSPLFPKAHCTRDGTICQAVTGEAEINAASTITALVHSPAFDLRRTYFLIAGIGGISPKQGTLGSVAFARFAVQVALQREFDARDKPADFPSGYFPQGTTSPGVYPHSIYGTEVFELNDDLRQLAIGLAKTGTLVDDARSQQYRANYATDPDFAPAAAPPSVIACDTATSDVYWSGPLLAAAFENTTALFTNGTATYCTTQQEDNAIFEALVRGARAGLVDFARVMIMRTGSDFERPYPGQTAAENLFAHSPGFDISISNIPAAGVPVVTGIVAEWDARFEKGIKPSNYVGDILGSLGGTPDFGPGSIFVGGDGVAARRSLRGRVNRF
ncbi:purine nucleoside permease [Trametes versicolor FP-101664 SS1]|uniref:purine nucleoside permease n=1 Tax=Trametes versicolor (strain FP-101664) TaxID=717944 RepID=UPI00046224A2|nr:purine nucleoside permease [Trametes versicolor FP-101664 SS1]EIW52532.1 purine nucleoside permease [Trametes versicolor FP-101664 SS1]